MITLTYGAGIALAAFAGVLAAPIYSVNPNMGSNFIIVVFAVVVIGGMGSILGSIVTGFGLGVVEGLTKVFYPQASATVIFVVMVIVLLARPAGLFGKADLGDGYRSASRSSYDAGGSRDGRTFLGFTRPGRAWLSWTDAWPAIVLCTLGVVPGVPDEGAVLRPVRLRL